MNTISKILLCGFGLILTAACTKEMGNRQLPLAGGEMLVEAVVDNNSSESKLTFGSEEGNRVVVKWKEEGEAFSAIFGDGAVSSFKQTGLNGAKATFRGPIPEGTTADTKVYAIYPATSETTLEAKAVALDLSVQDGALNETNSYLYDAVTAGDLANGLSFKHLTSVMKLSIAFKNIDGTAVTSGTVTNLTFTDENLATQAVVDLTGTYPVYTLTKCGSITLSREYELNAAAQAVVYLYILPAELADIKVVGYIDGVPYEGVIAGRADGKLVEAGKMYTKALDCVVPPVTFPVVFPLGYPEGAAGNADGYYYIDTKNEWAVNWAYADAMKAGSAWVGKQGTVLSKDQRQASISWYWDQKIVDLGVDHKIEVVNTDWSARKIGTFGVKGIWTDDYFEFVIPVKDFAANTTLCLTMPIYTRGGPVFWEVKYLDGSDWKTTATADLPAADNSEYKATATWAVKKLYSKGTDNSNQSVNMTFDKAIPAGSIKIQVKCVDGSIVAGTTKDNDTSATPTEVTKPQSGISFYFYNPGDRNNQKISISVVE